MVVLGEGIHGKVETDRAELCEALRCAISDDTTTRNHVLIIPARQKGAKGDLELRRIDFFVPSDTSLNNFRVATV